MSVTERQQDGHPAIKNVSLQSQTGRDVQRIRGKYQVRFHAGCSRIQFFKHDVFILTNEQQNVP